MTFKQYLTEVKVQLQPFIPKGAVKAKVKNIPIDTTVITNHRQLNFIDRMTPFIGKTILVKQDDDPDLYRQLDDNLRHTWLYHKDWLEFLE